MVSQRPDYKLYFRTCTVGRSPHRKEHPPGFYTSSDRIKTWGGRSGNARTILKRAYALETER